MHGKLYANKCCFNKLSSRKTHPQLRFNSSNYRNNHHCNNSNCSSNSSRRRLAQCPIHNCVIVWYVLWTFFNSNHCFLSNLLHIQHQIQQQYMHHHRHLQELQIQQHQLQQQATQHQENTQITQRHIQQLVDKHLTQILDRATHLTISEPSLPNNSTSTNPPVVCLSKSLNIILIIQPLRLK